MKVLQVGPNSIHVRLFSKAIMEHGIDCSFLAEEKLDGYTTQVFSFRSSNPLSLIANYQQLKTYLKKSRPDLSTYSSGKSFGGFCCSSLS